MEKPDGIVCEESLFSFEELVVMIEFRSEPHLVKCQKEAFHGGLQATLHPTMMPNLDFLPVLLRNLGRCGPTKSTYSMSCDEIGVPSPPVA